MTRRVKTSPYETISCPVAGCKATGSVPGIRRHVTLTHVAHRDIRDDAVNMVQVVKENLDVQTSYSLQAPRKSRAKSAAGKARYATLIAQDW
jgi:hypothetical protein